MTWSLDVYHQRKPCGLLQVAEYFEKHWLKDAEHWATFGRLEVLHLESHSNNLTESFHRKFKKHEQGDKIASRVEDLASAPPPPPPGAWGLW